MTGGRTRFSWMVLVLLLLVALFVSGISGLTYQVLWLRLLSLVFGVTAYAASTVLASFMTGLALGSFLAGRVAPRIRHPLVWFGCAELAIGLSALATPYALEAIGRGYGVAVGAVGDTLAAATVLRFVCALVVLIVPTTLMGATLPLVVASPLVRSRAVASRIGALYGANTAGAICGALLTGFYLIGSIGIRATFMWAAVLNALAGAVAIHLSRRAEPDAANLPESALPESASLAGHRGDVRRDVPTTGARPATPTETGSARAGVPVHAQPAGPPAWLMPVVFALSGFASLALEVIWFRVLVLYLPATTYAFTTMLATVLGGLAAGGWIAARLLRRDRDWLTWLTLTQLATSLVVLGSLTLLSYTYAAGWRTSGQIQASVVAILPAALLMGMAFPIGLRLAAGHAAEGAADRPDAPASQSIARRVGNLYALNVLGAIGGSALAGFLLLPFLGSRLSLIVCAGLYLASSLVLAGVWPRRRQAIWVVQVGLALFVAAAWTLPDPFDATLVRRHGRLERELWRHEGVQTTVTVHARPMGGHTLYLDGLHQANDSAEMLHVHRQIGHLAVALHPDPKDVLVIGLGGGVTAGAASQHPVSLDVVELSDGVRQAAKWFAHVNYNVLAQRNVTLRVDDGRNFLTRRPRAYDVITADIIQPIHAGAGHLYSVEYFQVARAALRENGLMLQWIGHRPRTQYELIARTFISVFPDATLWADGTLLVGTTRPFSLSRRGFERQLAVPSTRAALAWVGLTSFDALASLYTAGPDALRAVIGPGPILTDDHPRIEYHRALPHEQAPFDVGPLRGDTSGLNTEANP